MIIKKMGTNKLYLDNLSFSKKGRMKSPDLLHIKISSIMCAKINLLGGTMVRI